MEIIKPLENFKLRLSQDDADPLEIIPLSFDTERFKIIAEPYKLDEGKDLLNIKPLFDMEKITINVEPYNFEVKKSDLIFVEHLDEILHQPLQVIQRSDEPCWKERGWTKIPNGSRGCTYHGYYLGRFFFFKGLIEEKYFPGDFEFFIFNPSAALKAHSHWQCFNNYRGDNKFFIHFTEEPKDVYSGIAQVESIISEAYRDY